MLQLNLLLLLLHHCIHPTEQASLRSPAMLVASRIKQHFPPQWTPNKQSNVLQFIQLTSAEPQEEANPDTWAKAYATPFDVKNGGGDEPEVNYDYETNGENGGTSIDPKQKPCTKNVGAFLQGCVYLLNQNLNKEKKQDCAKKVAGIGAECVFGPVD